MNRRGFLAGACGCISVVLAGCMGDYNFVLSMEPVADAEALVAKSSVIVADDHDMNSELDHVLEEGWQYEKTYRDDPLFEADAVYQYENAFYSINPREEPPEDASDAEASGTEESGKNDTSSASQQVSSGEPDPNEVDYYDVELLATGVDEYIAHLRDEYRIELTGLTDAQKATVEEAIEEHAYTTYDDMSDAYESVWETITEGPELPNDDPDLDHLVYFDGTEYFVDTSTYTSEL